MRPACMGRLHRIIYFAVFPVISCIHVIAFSSRTETTPEWNTRWTGTVRDMSLAALFQVNPWVFDKRSCALLLHC